MPKCLRLKLWDIAQLDAISHKKQPREKLNQPRAKFSTASSFPPGARKQMHSIQALQPYTHNWISSTATGTNSIRFRSSESRRECDHHRHHSWRHKYSDPTHQSRQGLSNLDRDAISTLSAKTMPAPTLPTKPRNPKCRAPCKSSLKDPQRQKKKNKKRKMGKGKKRNSNRNL